MSPIYSFICEDCTTKFERQLSQLCRNDPQKCECGGCAERVVSLTSPPQFRGEGFHCTDYPKGGKDDK